MNKAVLTTCISLIALASGSLFAQETPRYDFDLGAGFSTPLGTTGQNSNTGWDLRAGAGINFNRYVGARLNVSDDGLGISNGALTSLGLAGGNQNIFSVRIDPVVHLTPQRHFDVYLTGGGGYYHRQVNFGQVVPGAVPVANNFFGSGSTVVGNYSYSDNKPGIDGGVGLAMGSKWHGKFFAEARYNRMFLNNSHVDFLPVTFGFRW
jgi:hypothetical protein